MKNETKIAILIPTYNEATNIEKLLLAINEEVEKFTNKPLILLLDDNSKDETAKVANQTAKNCKNFHFQISSGEKNGLGAAYLRGIFEISKTQNFSHIIQMDADFSHPVSALSEFEKLAKDGKQLMIASRYVKNGKTPSWNKLRRFLSVSANLTVRLFLGRKSAIVSSKIKDITGGFNCYSFDLINSVADKIDANGYAFQIEAKFRATEKLKMQGKTNLIEEFPICFSERASGYSKIPIATVFKTISVSFKLRSLLKSHKPCCA